ncbi:hypothetical protein B0H10DRAFT_2050766 [Mycena sp. CBHHK59/15]|nr:hypothetical protein B0H10DRAFT_2050766 [Mycena sp. CBHHK59/15]
MWRSMCLLVFSHLSPIYCQCCHTSQCGKGRDTTAINNRSPDFLAGPCCLSACSVIGLEFLEDTRFDISSFFPSLEALCFLQKTVQIML